MNNEPKTVSQKMTIISKFRAWFYCTRIYCWYHRFIHRNDISNYVLHARREFIALGYDLDEKEEGPNKWIVENVIELLEVFSEQGHSGSSAPFAIEYFRKLADFEPLSPLTGEDDEWNETAPGFFQNMRCSHVFKDRDGRVYDIYGKIFREKNGNTFTSGGSHVDIEFPYTPKPEYVDVDEDGNPIAVEED